MKTKGQAILVADHNRDDRFFIGRTLKEEYLLRPSVDAKAPSVVERNIQRLIRKCFDAKEWVFVWADEGFRQQVISAETLDAMEEVSKQGAILLLKRDGHLGHADYLRLRG